MNTATDPTVEIPLSEIQRIRDRLMRLRDRSPEIRQLFQQIAGLYQRLSQQLADKKEGTTP